MKTAMITGVTGQDGAYLSRLLLRKGYAVVGLKRRNSIIHTPRLDDVYEHPNFKMEYFDLNDVGCVYALLMKYEPDEFYNLAAQSHVRVSFDIPENTVDGVAMGPLRILNAIKQVRPECRFYQASSSEMFGDNPNPPFNEDSTLMPASPYACAKVFAHNIVRNYRKAYGMHASSGILFNHESPLRGENFVTKKITLAAARIKLGIQKGFSLGNLSARRDWGYAGDYVKAMWLMLQQDIPDDYVVATGEDYSVLEFLETVFDIADLGSYEKYVKIDPRLYRPHEVPCLIGDASKAHRKLGWEPEYDFVKLVETMYRYDFEKVLKQEV